jgi:geranylgeranyl diphosphate synthase, type II
MKPALTLQEFGVSTAGYRSSSVDSDERKLVGSRLSISEMHAKVERALTEVEFPAPAGAERLAEAARYALLGGGKRVRPTLVMACAQALGAPVDRVLPTACAIELIHTNSLIVDDLPAMDNHAKRRGRPTLHRLYGDDIAILAGCALLSEAQRLILEDQPGAAELRNRVLREVLEATGTAGMVGGQFLDVTKYRPSDRDDLERMQMLKTGSLIVACVRCGTLIADNRTNHAFDRFAEGLGSLFQVVDDILDETGKARWLGKIPGGAGAHRTAARDGRHGLSAGEVVRGTARRSSARRMATRMWWAPVVVVGVLTDRGSRARWVMTPGIVMLAASASTAGKLLIRRPRPGAPTHIALGRLSAAGFPSTHTACAFAIASWHRGSRQRRWLHLVAIAIGYLRVRRRAHYYGDVVAGAFLGYGIAWQVDGIWSRLLTTGAARTEGGAGKHRGVRSFGRRSLEVSAPRHRSLPRRDRNAVPGGHDASLRPSGGRNGVALARRSAKGSALEVN